MILHPQVWWYVLCASVYRDELEQLRVADQIAADAAWAAWRVALDRLEALPVDEVLIIASIRGRIGQMAARDDLPSVPAHRKKR